MAKKTLKSIADAPIEKRFYGEGRIPLSKILNFKILSKKKHHKEVLTLKSIYAGTPREGKTYIRKMNDHLGWLIRNAKANGVKITPIEEKNGDVYKIKIEF